LAGVSGRHDPATARLTHQTLTYFSELISGERPHKFHNGAGGFPPGKPCP
jgi:hypothetical protein